jgi:glutamate-ammonia-ligase adenylyltransferase
LESLIATALDRVRRHEPLSVELLAQLGDTDPVRASEALGSLSALPEMTATRSSWLPALLLSARPGVGARRFRQLVEQMRTECGHRLDPAQMPSLALLLGCSDFLGRLLVEHPHWALDLAGDPPSPPKEREPLEGSGWLQIREAKYRGLARVAARELVGCPLPDSLREVSALVERCVVRALECAAREARCDVPTTIALGDLASRELSLVPELELVLLAPARLIDRFTEFAAAFQAGLDKPQGIGALYRVRLSGPTGPAWNGVAAVDPAIRAWQEMALQAEPWELRSRLQSARCLVGSGALARRFIAGTRELAAASQPPARSSFRAEFTYGDADDIRNGPGGIRQVQRLVQRLVANHAWQEPDLQAEGVYDALCRLGRMGALDEARARVLRDGYGWLRRAEHFLQLADEEPIHHFPRRLDQQNALARRMGYREVDASLARGRLLRDWQSVRGEVMSICA